MIFYLGWDRVPINLDEVQDCYGGRGDYHTELSILATAILCGLWNVQNKIGIEHHIFEEF